MTIFLVRHAPTASNHGGLFMGQADVPAVPVESPSPLAPAGPRTIYSSPLKRALSGAAVLFPGEPVCTSDLLLERSVGEWEGLSHTEVQSRWPGTFVDGVMSPYADPPGGESIDDLCARVTDFFALVSGSAEDVYVVTHNGWIRAAMMLEGQVTFHELFAEPVPFLEPIQFELTSS